METKTFPFQDIVTENKIEVSLLPTKTQKQIAKFTTLAADPKADEDELESMDENISINLMDYLEQREKEEKLKERKDKHTAVKEKIKIKETSVDDAPTAQKNGKEKEKKTETKTRSFMDIISGRK